MIPEIIHYSLTLETIDANDIFIQKNVAVYVKTFEIYAFSME